MPINEIITAVVTVLVSMIGSGLLLALINRKRDNNKAAAEIRQTDSDQKLEEQAAEISYSEKAVQMAYSLLPRLREEIDTLKQEIKDLKEAFAKQTEIISGQLQRIVKLQGIMETQSETIKNMQKVMMDKDMALADKDMKLASMAMQIIERDSAIVNQEHKITALEAKVERLEKAQLRQTGELKTLQDNSK